MNIMKTTKPLLFSLLMLLNPCAWADTGLINVPSGFSVAETAERFAAAAEKAGLTIFARIDHAAGAAATGQTLRPTRLIIFGSPKVGTALMSSDQRVGIDLPLKALAWQDAEGKVWLSYNSAEQIVGRFAIADREAVRRKIAGAQSKLAQAATQVQE